MNICSNCKKNRSSTNFCPHCGYDQRRLEAGETAEGCLKKGVALFEDESYEDAVAHLIKAAYAGIAEAQNYLGECYEFGLGSDEDDDEAFKWFSTAAEKNFAPAIFNLGECYEFGYGTEIDFDKAVALYKRAASLGDEEAAEWLKDYGDIDDQ